MQSKCGVGEQMYSLWVKQLTQHTTGAPHTVVEFNQLVETFSEKLGVLCGKAPGRGLRIHGFSRSVNQVADCSIKWSAQMDKKPCCNMQWFSRTVQTTELVKEDIGQGNKKPAPYFLDKHVGTATRHGGRTDGDHLLHHRRGGHVAQPPAVPLSASQGKQRVAHRPPAL